MHSQIHKGLFSSKFVLPSQTGVHTCVSAATQLLRAIFKQFPLILYADVPVGHYFYANTHCCYYFCECCLEIQKKIKTQQKKQQNNINLVGSCK